MGVLVEALTLVVPKRVLAPSYPGGADAFLQNVLRLENPPRYACDGDAHLVNVSFYDSSHVRAAVEFLVDCGIVGYDDDQFVEFAFVDQQFGPTLPCDWLEWRRCDAGFTMAWLAGTEPGDMAAPTDWTPECSRQLFRHDVRDEPDRFLRMTEDDGSETWLDFNTGQMSRGLPQRNEVGNAGCIIRSPSGDATDASGRPGPMIAVVERVLGERGLRYLKGDDSSVATRVREARAYYHVIIMVHEAWSQIVCHIGYSVRVPQNRRLALADAVCRANWGLRIGCFELDVSKGDLRFRVSTDVEGGSLVPIMLHNMLDAGLFAVERYHDAFMQVAFAGAEPVEAIAAAEEKD